MYLRRDQRSRFRAGRDTNMSGHSQRIFDHLGNQLAIRHDTWCQLNDLLVSSLNAALAFPKVCYSPTAVSNDLNFDVPETINCSFLSKYLLGRALFDCSFDQSR